MKQINEIIVLATMFVDENIFLSVVDLSILTNNEGKFVRDTYANAIWDSRTDSVYLLSGSPLDYFLEHTNLLKAVYSVDNYFDNLVEVE